MASLGLADVVVSLEFPLVLIKVLSLQWLLSLVRKGENEASWLKSHSLFKLALKRYRPSLPAAPVCVS